jgi:hypothetical protein
MSINRFMLVLKLLFEPVGFTVTCPPQVPAFNFNIWNHYTQSTSYPRHSKDNYCTYARDIIVCADYLGVGANNHFWTTTSGTTPGTPVCVPPELEISISESPNP